MLLPLGCLCFLMVMLEILEQTSREIAERVCEIVKEKLGIADEETINLGTNFDEGLADESTMVRKSVV